MIPQRVLYAKVNSTNTIGVIISLNCETDFVAKNETYISLANELAEFALNFETLESFLDAEFNGMTVSEKLTEQTVLLVKKLKLVDLKHSMLHLLGHIFMQEIK